MTNGRERAEGRESSPLVHILTRKLEGFAGLSGDDVRAVEQLCSDIRTVEAGTELIREGERPNRIHVLLEGWAYRYKLLPNGSRQILAYLIPGDLCDIHIFILKAMDHGISLLSPGRVAFVPPDEMLSIMERHPAIARALWWATLVDEAILREWLVNVGQRDAYERIAHLLYEMYLRVRAVGLVDGDETFSLPLTEAQLGDTVGLTPVAVNRALQRLRSENLITLEERRLTVHTPERLGAVTRFQPAYLHLDRRGPDPDR